MATAPNGFSAELDFSGAAARAAEGKASLQPSADIPHTGSKYLRRVLSVDNSEFATVDVYCVLETYDVRCPARQYAIKKLLCAGLRNKGSQLQDLIEARDAVSRAIQLQEARERKKSDV